MADNGRPQRGHAGNGSKETEIVRYGFLLLPEFPMYALIPAVEALRIANQNSGKTLYSWHFFSGDGKPVKAGNGMSMPVEAAVADVPWFPTVFVCAGNHPTHHFSKRVLNWLRRLARHRATLADRYRYFCLGRCRNHPRPQGNRPLRGNDDVPRPVSGHRDIGAALCSRPRSHHLCRRCRGARPDDASNRPTARTGTGADRRERICRTTHPPRQRTATFCWHNIFPATTTRRSHEYSMTWRKTSNRHWLRENSRAAPASRVALWAVFLRDRVGESPMRYYLKVRLQAARNSLFYSDIPIQDVAISCGFSSPEVLSRSFRVHFGMSPREFRQQVASEQLRRFRPELEQQIWS